jgi:hypothetical protein
MEDSTAEGLLDKELTDKVAVIRIALDLDHIHASGPLSNIDGHPFIVGLSHIHRLTYSVIDD